MERFFRRVMVVLGVAIAALLGAALAASFALRSAAGRERVRVAAERLLGEVVAGRVTIGEVTALHWLGADLAGVAIERQGKRILTAERAAVDLRAPRRWPPLAAIAVRLDAVALDVERDAAGGWDLVELFAAPADERSSPPPLWLAQVSFAVTSGRATLRGLRAAPIDVPQLSGAAAVRFAPRAAAVLVIDHAAAGLPQGSALGASGWIDLDSGALSLDLSAQPLAAADLGALAGFHPTFGEARGSAQLGGSTAAPRIEVALAAGEARFEAKAQLAPLGGDTELAAWAMVSGLDPQQLAPQAPGGAVAGEASLRARFAADGDAVPVELEGEARVWQSAVAGVSTDWLTAQARREGEELRVEMQAAAPGDAWSASASAALGVAAPHALHGELRGELANLALLGDAIGNALPRSALRGSASVSAAALGDADRSAEILVTLDGSELRGLRLERAGARLRLGASLLEVAELRAQSGRSEVSGTGWLDVAADAARAPLQAQLAGTLDLAALRAFGIESFGGETSLAATAWGARGAIDAKIDLTSRGALATPAGDATLTATLEAKALASPVPRATLQVDGTLAPAPAWASVFGDGAQSLALSATFARDSAGARRGSGAVDVDHASLELRANSADGRTQHLAAQIDLTATETRIALGQLHLHPRVGGAWVLERPGAVRLAADSVETSLALRSARGAIALDGTLRRAGGPASRFGLDVHALDAALLCAAGDGRDCTGQIDAHLELAGSQARPQLSGSVHGARLTVGGQAIGDLALRLWSDGGLHVEGALAEPTAGTLRLAARLPLEPGWPLPGIAAHAPLEVSLRSDGIGLSSFAGLVGRQTVTGVSGRLRVDARLGGTLAEPRLSGELDAEGLGFDLVATGVKYRDGRVVLRFAEHAIEVAELALNGAALRGGGRIDVAAPGGPSFDLWFLLQGLPVFDRADGDARASGRLALGGSWQAPLLRGKLTVDPATLHPSLVPGTEAAPPDPTIVVLRSAADEARTAPSDTFGDALRAQSGAPSLEPNDTLWQRTSLEVAVALGSSVFVRRRDAEVRLVGELYATKAARGELVLTGEIDSQRGWYVFQGRRLVVDHAYVRFSGESPIDPYLDVLAVYRSPEYRVSVAVQGTVRKPTLLLSSEPPLDQSDILAVLLFGKPASQLSGGQGVSLQQQAVALLASYVAPQLEQSVRETFGLTSVTFQMPSGNTAGTVGLGRYFGQDLFVSLAQDFGGPQGGTARQLQGLIGSSVTVQYYLTPNVTLQGAASSQGESAIDLIWQRRY